jgi:hypothetical protein
VRIFFEDDRECISRLLSELWIPNTRSLDQQRNPLLLRDIQKSSDRLENHREEGLHIHRGKSLRVVEYLFDLRTGTLWRDEVAKLCQDIFLNEILANWRQSDRHVANQIEHLITRPKVGWDVWNHLQHTEEIGNQEGLVVVVVLSDELNDLGGFQREEREVRVVTSN